MSDIVIDPVLADRRAFTNAISPFRAKTSEIDQIHQKHVQEFCKAVWSLIDGDGGPFKGPASEAFATLVGNYIQVDSPLTDEEAGLSQKLAQASTYCEQAAHEINHLIDTFPFHNQGSDATHLSIIVGSGLAKAGLGELALWSGLAAAAVTTIVVTGIQSDQLQQMDTVRQRWFNTMENLAAEKEPGLPPEPNVASIIAPPQANLTPQQEILRQNVQYLLGNSPYNTGEIDDLIRAGYLDPAAIAAIIRSGNTALFNDKNIANMMNELTSAQELRFIAIVDQYRQTHPGLTSHEIYNYLRYSKMKAQLDGLYNDINNYNLVFQGQVPSSRKQDLLQRLDKKVGRNFRLVTDPFTITDNKLNGWYDNLTGVWGEWATIKKYSQQNKLVDYTVPITEGEVDIKIKEPDITGNSVIKWVEVKNVKSLTSTWGGALDQVRWYITIDSADYIIIELPQQGTKESPGPSKQQLALLQKLQKDFPNVKFEVRMRPAIPPIPFDPPSDNWGTSIP